MTRTCSNRTWQEWGLNMGVRGAMKGDREESEQWAWASHIGHWGVTVVVTPPGHTVAMSLGIKNNQNNQSTLGFVSHFVRCWYWSIESITWGSCSFHSSILFIVSHQGVVAKIQYTLYTHTVYTLWSPKCNIQHPYPNIDMQDLATETLMKGFNKRDIICC